MRAGMKAADPPAADRLTFKICKRYAAVDVPLSYGDRRWFVRCRR
jgi:hypothetical protein